MSAIVDLFAGPGGWDVGARLAGLDDPLGIEHGIEECETRRAAGLPTLQGDVAAVPLDPFRGLEGLIASPPCQAWSMAGAGLGRTHDVELVQRAAEDLASAETRRHLEADGLTTRDLLETYRAECADPRSILVVEPLRWALELQPVWMAWEQVPPVEGFWRLCAGLLEDVGYRTWVGVLSAERYGVPQTRQRAILLAARDGRPVGPPAATHQRYLPPRKLTGDGLFDADVFAECRVHPEDRDLQPWVSMADALGWTPDALVGFPRRADIDSNKAAGVIDIDGTEYRERDLRPASEPAQVVTEKARSWNLHANAKRSHGAVRALDEPAPTITAGNDVGDRVFMPAEVVDTGNTRGGTRPEGRSRGAGEPAVSITSRADQLEVRPTHYDRRQVDGRTGIPVRRREVDEPAPTITGEANGAWVTDRPATTIAGDPRVHPPGHKVNAEDLAAGRDGYEGRAGKNAIRVTVEQAAALQSFPPDHPWQGSRSAKYRQIGNAVPPLLAAAVLSSIAAPVPVQEQETRA